MHTRNKRGLKKVGLLALALVIALGALGVGYAAWTDEIYIQGTVNTGTLDIDVVAVSSTFAYKVPGAPDTGYGPETVIHYVDDSVDPDPYTPESEPPGFEVASAVTTFDNSDDVDLAAMTLSGLFPCIDFQTDLQLEYRGTVPGIVNVATLTPEDPGDTVLTELWELGLDTKDDPEPEGIWLDGAINRNDGEGWIEILEPEGLQLHRFDKVHVTLHVHLPEGEDYQNLDELAFTGTISVIQWNLYDEE